MNIRPFAAVAAALSLSNCAIHPVPQDVTGLTTYQIVRQIRCETREAAAALVLKELRREAEGGGGQAGDPIAQRLVAAYEADPELISTFKPEVFPAGPRYSQFRNLYRVFYSAAIAYNFDLTMSEENDLGTVLDFTGPLKPAFTLGLKADANRGRSNERTFTITDTFGGLLTQLNTPVRGQRYCDGRIVGPNYVYPIAGRIGVDELVTTFFELSLFGGLAGNNAAPGAGTPPSVADKLTFTTTLDASGTPKWTFSPAGTRFQFADASLTGLANRVDKHQVTVGLAEDPKAMAYLTSLRSYLFSRGRTVAAPGVSGSIGGVLVLNTITANAATSAEQLAVIAVDHLKSREVQLVPAP